MSKKTPIEAALFGLIHAEAEDRGAFFADTNGVLLFQEDGYDVLSYRHGNGHRTREQAYRLLAEEANITLANVSVNDGPLNDILILQLGNEFVEGLQSANAGVIFSESESRAWCAGWNIATAIILKDEAPARAAVPVPVPPAPRREEPEPVHIDPSPIYDQEAESERSKLLARKETWDDEDYQKAINFEPFVSYCHAAHNAMPSDEKDPEIGGHVYICMKHGADIQVEFSDRRPGVGAVNELTAWAVAYRELMRRVEEDDDIPF